MLTYDTATLSWSLPALNPRGVLVGQPLLLARNGVLLPSTTYAVTLSNDGSKYLFTPTPPGSALFPLWAAGDLIVGYYVSVTAAQ